jgi:3-phenylpropionate/trans-cinnamate dioxygenase ferredoxin reductase subunit
MALHQPAGDHRGDGERRLAGEGHDLAVVRGNPDTGRSFAVFYLREGALIAVDAVNRAPEFMMSKQLIAERAKIDPVRLGDEGVAMKDMRN